MFINYHFLVEELVLASSSDPARLLLHEQSASKPLDPAPITKWAEEGFAVVTITTSDEVSLTTLALKEALEALQALEQVDVKRNR